MDNPTLIRSAKLLTIPIPLLLAGWSLGFSRNSVPPLYDQPADISTPIFVRIFYSGGPVILPGSLITQAATAYLTYIEPANRRIWGFAFGCQVALSLWTWLVMFKGIGRLITISESPELQEKATANLEARQLMVRWVKQNYVRSALLAATGFAALGATFTL